MLESTAISRDHQGRDEAILEETGLRCGEEFFLAYSPERPDPTQGCNDQGVQKPVGGVDATSTDLAMLLYDAAVEQAHRVESAEIAESAKILENVYPAVNIALVNELSSFSRRWTSTSGMSSTPPPPNPSDSRPSTPDPDSVDTASPSIRSTWPGRPVTSITPPGSIELAGEVNAQMPAHVVNRTAEVLNDEGRSLERRRAGARHRLQARCRRRA